MSFGVIQTMITTLKNNEKMRSKREKFKRTFGSNSSNKKPEYDFPEATPEVLNEIRYRLKKENKILWIKIIGFTIIIVAGMVWMLLSV